MMIKRKPLIGNDGYVFPMFNPRGLKSAITPFFAGDLKTDHDHYALSPASVVDVFNPTFSRNVFFEYNGKRLALNGQTESQSADDLTYETGLLYQRVTRTGPETIIDTTSYVPLDDMVEVHKIVVTNTTKAPLLMRITTAIPLFGRSADNLRDHRHVTSLLNVIEVVDSGIMLSPTLTFDERGHQVNKTVYSVFAQSPELTLDRYIPVTDDFMAGGSLSYPRGLDSSRRPGDVICGYEAIGALGFKSYSIEPGQTITLFLSIGIHQSQAKACASGMRYLNHLTFDQGLEDVHAHYMTHVQKLSFHLKDEETSRQLSWVAMQPLLRRDFGNSYMPHHDYGRGGRGWRDLWQDLLALIMMNDQSVSNLIINNLAGVRIDGSNATIIGDQPGQFLADRNKIPRVWSDHGAWPLLTIKMYLDETGETDILFKKQTYFKDNMTHYVKKNDPSREEGVEKDAEGRIYQGTVLEHLLLENLVGYHNVGAHGFLRLEDADWNDGLDMAPKYGESIAFSHMYAGNLLILSDIVATLETDHLCLFEALESLLLDHPDLHAFFDKVKDFDGKTIKIEPIYLKNCLKDLAQSRIDFLRNQAFAENRFLSYYTEARALLDRPHDVNLTGQAIALLSKTPTEAQANVLKETTRKALFDKHGGGYRLNTPYKDGMNDIGRAFGFAYGHKENGAVFSHMAVMYAYGLYQYDLIDEGREAYRAILDKAQDPSSKLWLGIPEYFNDQGIGMYPYLTGSASWMLKLLREQVFGIRLSFGSVHFEPKLSKEDFINGKASIKTMLFGHLRTVSYHNPKGLDHKAYRVVDVKMGGRSVPFVIDHIDGDIEVMLDV
ncbi:MAG: hypothetical protein K9K93_06750 [Acholeplasmataceae bacterium]|nr:hypothetical protein [Acholeplasmataceae bacterium]